MSLNGTPWESVVPDGGVRFEIRSLARITALPQLAVESGAEDTLGALMHHEYDGGSNVSVFHAPEQFEGLPVSNTTYALYRLEGQMLKRPGDFGVYDITFGLDEAVDGVWVEAYEQCESCDEIDGFDLHGSDVGGLESLERAFDVQVLVRIDGRTPQELDAFVRELPLVAMFSGEEWNFSYEQHLTTTRIGPRTAVRIEMTDE